jgi:signal transduction histidine kinase
VRDNGRGVSEEQFRGLTAVRRFRGDEGRNRRPGAPGLGLAVAQEVVDRSNMQLDLKRPGAGGFEVEFSGPAGA